MNRYELTPRPKEPGLIPIDVAIESGDTVVNLEKVYTHEGHYEAGCKWLVRDAPTLHRSHMWVYPLVDGSPTNTMIKAPCFFRVIAKGPKRKTPQEEEMEF